MERRRLAILIEFDLNQIESGPVSQDRVDFFTKRLTAAINADHWHADTMRLKITPLTDTNRQALYTERTKELLKLIAKLNAWGDESSRVSIGYMPARISHDDDSSSIDLTRWGFVASTQLCGYTDSKAGVFANGQAPELEDAIWQLAKNIAERHKQRAVAERTDQDRCDRWLARFEPEIK